MLNMFTPCEKHLPSLQDPHTCPRQTKMRLRGHSVLLLVIIFIASVVVLLNNSVGTLPRLSVLPPINSRSPIQPLLGEMPPSNLPLCERVMVFTGARQGSTWFVDSIEHCKYSMQGDKENGTLYALDVFKRTELWKHFGEEEHGGEVLDVEGVLKYIEANGSVKIFPSVFWRRKADVTELVRRREEIGMTVMILKRDVEAAWNSWVKAEASGGWNGATGDENHVERNETQHQYFVESRGRYDRGVEQLLQSVGLEVDVFDYDDVKDRKYIVAEKSGCYVQNCNFIENITQSDAGGEDRSDGLE